MDVNTHSRSTTAHRGAAKLDGPVATVGKSRRDGTAKLTVEVRDRTGERRIPVKLARNPRSVKFAQAVGELKAELLQRTRHDQRS